VTRALAVVAVLAVASPALAAPPSTTALGDHATAALRAANQALAAGDWERAAALVAALDVDGLAGADRAEAHRISGVAAFFLGRLADAERELLAYLSLDLDARLDPAVTPPEAVTFFDDVRARHAAELRALRPKPRRSSAINLLPPLGQFQNGERTKGWIIAGTGVALLATNIGSYVALRQWCDEGDGTCSSGDRARRMRVVNLVSGVGLAATYLYGVIDGYVGYRRRRGPEVQVVPTESGAAVFLSGDF
jgi:hypothetical protein